MSSPPQRLPSPPSLLLGTHHFPSSHLHTYQTVLKSPTCPSVSPIGLEINHWTLGLRPGIQTDSLLYLGLHCLGPHGVFKFFCIHCQKFKIERFHIKSRFLASLDKLEIHECTSPPSEECHLWRESLVSPCLYRPHYAL